MKRQTLIFLACLGVLAVGCSDDGPGTTGASGSESDSGSETTASSGEETSGDSMTGDGDGDPATGDGDGDATGDGDGDATGDGDGDATGDGDGDATGDGDGDAIGDGDGDMTGDGDGDMTGDGDGDPNACMSNDDCDAGNCVNGDCVYVTSCLELEQLDPDLPSGVYELDPDGPDGFPTYFNYCDLETDGGGWTMIIKADGNLMTFAWDAFEWQTPDSYQENEFQFDHTEAKLPSWSLVSVSEVMLGMEAPISNQDPPDLSYLVLDVPDGDSLYDIMMPGDYVQTDAGRIEWLDLIGGSSLQQNCNREGLNVTGDMPNDNSGWHKVRIGILGNEQNDCSSPDSRLGIGGEGTACGTSNSPVGNFAGCTGGNDVDIPSFGVVFVR